MQVDTYVQLHTMMLNGLGINILRIANESICALLSGFFFHGKNHSDELIASVSALKSTGIQLFCFVKEILAPGM